MSARMSRSSTDSSWGKRRSLFALQALSSSSQEASNSSKADKSKRSSTHRRGPSLTTDFNHPDLPHDTTSPVSASSPTASRPTLSIRGKRHTTSDLKLILRSSSDELAQDAVPEPLSATSSTASFGLGDGNTEQKVSARTVLLHGEVQTSAGMFRKKKEYLVLTETHVIRLKSQARAAEMFRIITQSGSRPGLSKSASAASQGDMMTHSDSSGDKEGRVPLRQVVAVYRVDDAKQHYAIEVCFLDEESTQSSSLVLGFSSAEERDVWLKNLRSAADNARLREENYISASNIENAARIVERAHDYDPANCSIYKVVQKMTVAKTGRTSSDDLLKVATTVCFLAVGVHKVHLIQLSKPTSRGSSPATGHLNAQMTYGILTLTAVRVSEFDDTLELTFRQPLSPPRTLYLASTAASEIAARLHFSENYLRPECAHRLFKFSVPNEVRDLLAPPVSSEVEEHCCLDRTLSAYCVAYGLNPANVRYTINYDCEDAPRFELLPPADAKRPDYGPIALLAIMRAMRYNETFGSISFAGIDLDSLNGLHDNYGQELVCSRTKRGTPIRLTPEELQRACLLVQEIRALAVTNKKLRRMDFSACMTSKDGLPLEMMDDEVARARDIGCGIVEALMPLCKHQATNVDWICLNGIQLSDIDMDYLVGAAVDKSCHFRGLELNRCGLNERSIGSILDALRAQDNTLEAVEIAGNTARLDPSTFDFQLSMFGFIRKLNLSHISRTSGSEPLLTAETLLIWRLQDLRLSGTPLNEATIDAISTYLAHPQSRTLHELYFDNSYLSGKDVATLLQSLTQDPQNPRDLHLDISQNHLTRGLEEVTKAIAEGFTPSHLSMRAIEYREENLFRRMLAALTENKTIQYLDMSQTALQGDASDETCRALHKLLAENDTLVHLDLSGEDSRLSTFKFGPGINDALMGLKQNKSIQTLRVEKQKLGLQGASTLAEVLKENSSLRELHCGLNEIPLQGLTDLVNSLIENTTLIYLPNMDDGRDAALKAATATMRGLSSELETTASSQPSRPPPAPSSSTSTSTSNNSSGSSSSATGMRRGLNSVRRTAARASAYAPSFPALPSSSNRSSPTPSESPSKSHTAFSLTLPPPKTRRNSQTPVAASVLFTVQDIQTTHRLLTEQWDRQCYRLAKYLERNWNILHNVPGVNLEIEDEKFERPESVGSLGKVLEMVKSTTTPRKEVIAPGQKDGGYFELLAKDTQSTCPPAPAPYTSLTADEKHGLHFRPLVLGEGFGEELLSLEEPNTPTQKGFTLGSGASSRSSSSS